jgi:hypothetical protein
MTDYGIKLPTNVLLLVVGSSATIRAVAKGKEQPARPARNRTMSRWRLEAFRNR